MSAPGWSAALAPNLWEFCKYLDCEPTGEDVARAREMLGELRVAA